MKRPRPFRRCAKIMYPTKVDALIKLQAMEMRAHVVPGAYPPQAVYCCPNCRRWHLTSQEQKRKRA